MLRTILLNPLFNLLLVIYALVPGHDFGMAVIILTIIIRILLWPLVKKQLYQQKAMRELQPEIAKVKERAQGDKTRESQMMVELFKEKEVNPFGSLGLAFVQFPILIALYFVLRDVVDPAQITQHAYPFVAKLGAVKDIIGDPGGFHPQLFGAVDLTKPSIGIALLAGIFQYIQTKQIMPHDPSKSSRANAIGSNMALIFPVLTVVIAIKLPAALALYWTTSSIVAIIQQQRVLQADLKFMQALPLPRRRKNAKR